MEEGVGALATAAAAAAATAPAAAAAPAPAAPAPTPTPPRPPSAPQGGPLAKPGRAPQAHLPQRVLGHDGHLRAPQRQKELIHVAHQVHLVPPKLAHGAVV